ncbi:MAG: hypothetical protein O3C28_14165 [Proteobacteria bacterium]|nr:hypothetical protein [Pseudomonadota bacterium]
MKHKLILSSISAVLVIGAVSPYAIADWSGLKDYFKSESSKVIDSGTLSKAAGAAGLSQDQIANGLNGEGRSICCPELMKT